MTQEKTCWVIKCGKLYWGQSDIKWTNNIEYARIYPTRFVAQVQSWTKKQHPFYKVLRTKIKIVEITRTTKEI
jgi:hypothetical protein